MPLIDHRGKTDVLFAQVLSRDGSEVLVEGGSATPVRWFIDRGESLLREAAYDDDIKQDTKRRKLSKKSKVAVDNENDDNDIQHQITLARTVLDLHLSDKLELTKAGQRSPLPVILKHVRQDDGILSLQFAHTSIEGALINIDTQAVSKTLHDTLTRCIRPQVQTVASRYRCHLTAITDGALEYIQLEAVLAWQDGISAFPAGVPDGRTRIYEEYDIYTSFFPDASRDAIDHSQPWTPRDFYESVHTPEKTTAIEIEDTLDTTLFPFQKRAVQWMLTREDAATSASRPQVEMLSLHECRRGANGENLYCSPFLGVVTRAEPANSDIKGGILAEEMGLGKTVEIMALIAAHSRPQPYPEKLHDPTLDAETYPSRATLIITPATILGQWQSELSQHAPNLKVHTYTGVSTPRSQKQNTQDLQDLRHDYDVVLTTYQTLSRELHFATDPPERNMRHARKYERRKSPLVQIQWWRICLDEAQMVESGVTAAAQVACRLPRINSWAVSGTPVKKNVEDLYGLLVFLRLEPFASDRRLWVHMIINHRQLFRRLFKTIALRHTKSHIREDIQLPPQKRVVMTLPFTAVESQHYLTLFEEMCEDVGVEQDGSPSSGLWDPDNSRTVEKMRQWLTRLRQTCLHPQVGGRNRRRLGKGQGPLRTVAEVLEVMIEQTETGIRNEERAAINALLMRAHIIGNARDDNNRSKKALELYSLAQTKCTEIVSEARTRLCAAIAAGSAEATTSDGEDSASETVPLLGRLRNTLRTALQLLHVSIYFAATATYQIKVNTEITKPDSDEFVALEQRETDLYEQAKVVRREILKDAADKSERIIRKIRSLQTTNTLTNLPDIEDLDDVHGIESRRIVSKSYPLFDMIKDIKPYIVEWRAKIMEILTKALVDEDESGNEITGDEYEDSTKQQDELYVYFDALKALQADLNRCITGEAAPLIDHEAKTLVRTAKRWLDPEIADDLKQQPHAPELLLKLFDIHKSFRSKLEDVGSIRGLIAEARQLGDSGDYGARANVESELARRLSKELQGIMTSYTKALGSLQKEVDLCGSTQNQRLEFYRQLQELSDAVAPYKEELDETLDTQTLESTLNLEEGCLTNLAQLKTKHRFLLHLKDESGQEDSARICVICQCPFENGVLTVCGHQYCKDCIRHWWTQHRTCPVCKRRLALVDFHNITYKPKEVKVQEEAQSSNDTSTDTSPKGSSSIYSEVDVQLKDQIKSFDLSSSYGTKIDTISRHLLWIREHDPGAKSIVFSQYREFLDVLSAAFSEFKIGYQRLGRPGAVEKFRQDPSIDCLLLDAKTDSSGLTLVNATHVFVCEPLVQTAVELQAIARVHRIGQVRQTTVWMYLVNDTVEESIYEISVARRMAHVQARQTSRAFEESRSSTPGPLGEQAIDAANTEQLQNAPLSNLLASGKGSGELVEKKDLWQCLFGKAHKATPKIDASFRADFDRNLRAAAAQNRASHAI